MRACVQLQRGDIGSSKKRLEANDVVVSRLRSYLREIAIVMPSGAVPMVGSSEFIVLRRRNSGLVPEALLVYLRSPLVQTVLRWCQDGSNHPRFDEGELLRLPVPSRVKETEEDLVALVRKSADSKREARGVLKALLRRVDQGVYSGE